MLNPIGSILRAAFSRATVRKQDVTIRNALDRLDMVSEQAIHAKPIKLSDVIDALIRDRA